MCTSKLNGGLYGWIETLTMAKQESEYAEVVHAAAMHNVSLLGVLKVIDQMNKISPADLGGAL